MEPNRRTPSVQQSTLLPSDLAKPSCRDVTASPRRSFIRLKTVYAQLSADAKAPAANLDDRLSTRSEQRSPYRHSFGAQRISANLALSVSQIRSFSQPFATTNICR